MSGTVVTDPDWYCHMISAKPKNEQRTGENEITEIYCDGSAKPSFPKAIAHVI